MALNTDIVQKFFNDSKSKHDLVFKSKQLTQRLRVFDDPPTEEHIYSGQTQDKLKRNLGQTQEKLRTNSGQTQDKLKRNLGQTQDKLKRNLGQTQDKLNGQAFISLSRLQRQIALIIYEKSKGTSDRQTPPLAIEYIANACKTSRLSIQKTIQRLEKKGFIVRVSFKNGREGWTRYELVRTMFQEMMNEEISKNLGQT